MFNTFEFMVKLLKVNLVGYDYTGYGASKDLGFTPTEKQTYVDIKCVYEWCIDSGLVKSPEKELIIYGQSIGSGPSCYLASKRPVAGLILHSPILSGLRVITPSRFCACFDIFPNIQRIKSVKSPVFIIHGEQDVEVNIRHGRELLEALPATFRYEAWWVPRKGHNDILHANEREFIKYV
jgi:abhydrolase domain-containing protein 17